MSESSALAGPLPPPPPRGFIAADVTGIGTNGARPAATAEELAAVFASAHSSICHSLKGKQAEVRLALVCLFAQGHLLVEDVPGVGKTTLAKALAATLGLSWHRIQFTPDLLPSDITGVSIFDRNTSSFSFRPGGVFANVVLADEINRASPKTQAALLEAMEELQVTVDTTTYGLPQPFVVVATQNPVEHDGTYPLPVSELDRFLVRLRLGYPDRSSEMGMLQDQPGGRAVEHLSPVVATEHLQRLLAYPRQVYVAPALQGYMVDLARATRQHQSVAIGLSPRALLGLQRAARALAASHGREYVTPDDIKAMAGPVSEHRLVLEPDALYSDLTTADVVSQVLASVPVPVAGTGPSR